MADNKSTVPHLTGPNFPTWKLQCRMALMKEGLWDIVTGEEEGPHQQTHDAIAKFKKRKDRALATIVLAVSPTQLYLLGAEPDDPREVWEKLMNQFQRRSWSNKLSIRRKLYDRKPKKGEPIQEHVKGVIELFDELAVIGYPVEEEERVVHLLTSLPESFDMMVTALEANAEMPSLDNVTERIIHEERKIKERMEKEDSSEQNKALMAGKVSNHNFGSNNGQKLCYHCGKAGHIQKFCRSLLREERDEPKGGKHFRKFNKSRKEQAHMSEQQQVRTRKKKSKVKYQESSSSSDESEYESGMVVTENNNPNHLALSTECSDKDKWIVDSGSTKDMCNDKESFSEMTDLSEDESHQVKVGNGQTIPTNKKGTVIMKVTTEDGREEEHKLSNVLYVPDLTYNLYSVSQAVSSKQTVEFSQTGCKVRNEENEVILAGKKVGNLFYLNSTIVKNCDNAVHIADQKKSKEALWHSRYGHLGTENMKTLVKSQMVRGLDYNKSSEKEFCKPCVQGKIHRKKFPKTGGKRARKILDLVHSDVCGQMDVPSLSGSKYFLSFIDDKSRYVWAYILKHKSDVFEKFIEWKAMVEKQTGKKLKKLRSDNGGEYLSEQFTNYFKKEGICRELTIRKTPEQNGVAERLNRTLEETIRTMLCESGVPKNFWAEALATAVYLRNRCPTKAVTGMTPFEAWNGEKPSVDHLKVFGCLCYAHIPKDERKKLDSKAREAIFLGYGKEKKGYRLYDVSTKKIFFSRDVIFNEDKFRFTKEERNKQNKTTTEVEPEEEFLRIEANEENERSDDNEDEVPLSRPKRTIRTPDYYGEWVHLADSNISEPKTVSEAMSSNEKDEWMNAMENEINSLKKHDVWKLVELPEGRKTVGCKWIYKLKHDEDGNIERYKARLVAQGFSQKEGIDYDETFSPVVRFESIRTVLALAAQFGLSLHQMDVKTAFLNGELKEEIYMKQPPGYAQKGKEALVCLLHKSLYGLKQSARCWNEELDTQLKKMKFRQSSYDPCIYVRSEENEVFIIAVYVDDMIFGGEKEITIENMKNAVARKFDVEDMGKLHHFLGVKIIQNPKYIWIGQPAYIQALLRRFSMENSKAVDTPFDAGTKLVKAIESDNLCDKTIYQSAVGSLLFLSNRTRPDISFAVGKTARYSSNPSSTHWSAVKRIMRYLNGTIHLGLTYIRYESERLVGYSDADWAGDLDDRRSTSGYIFQLSRAPISWRSKKQTCVALSTAEAEYMALASAVQEAIWLERLISDLLGTKEETVTVYEDNQSTISMGKNQQYHGRTKHIAIKYHFVRENVTAGVVRIPYCKSEDMLADIFTKPLSAPRFKKLCQLIGMVEQNNLD